jgi:hypothetical protein
MKPTTRVLRVQVHRCTARLAFSHLNLHRLLKKQVPILLRALAVPPAGGGGPVATEAPPFRASNNKVEIAVQAASMWLCNDGPTSFGAPDVLQVLPTSMLVSFARCNAFVQFCSFGRNAPISLCTSHERSQHRSTVLTAAACASFCAFVRRLCLDDLSMCLDAKQLPVSRLGNSAS